MKIKTAKLFAGFVFVLMVTVACTADNRTGTDGPLFDPTQSTEAGSTANALQETLDTIVDDTGVPAIGAAAFDRNGVVDLAVAGIRRRGSMDAVTVDDRFHLGSNTKAMTAALLARLAEKDQGIGFDTTVADAFPTVPDIHDDYAEVTMAQLLAHTGGAPSEVPEIDDAVFDLPVVEGRALGARLVISEPAEISPNTVSRYSNAGYVIVGAALEAATGRSWEDLLRAEVFKPLGMTSCGFGAPATDGMSDEPNGHDGSGRPVFWDNPALLGPAGTVHCSMTDWGLFLAELLKGSSGDSDFLTGGSVDRLLAPAPVPVEGAPDLRAALGWLRRDGVNGPVYFHDGSNTAWYSQAVLVPGIDRIVLAVSNEEQTGQQAVGLALAALAELYPA